MVPFCRAKVMRSPTFQQALDRELDVGLVVTISYGVAVLFNTFFAFIADFSDFLPLRLPFHYCPSLERATVI